MKYVLIGYKIDESDTENPIYESDVLYYNDKPLKDIPVEWRLQYDHIVLYKQDKIHQRGLS